MSTLYLAPAYSGLASLMLISYTSLESAKTNKEKDDFMEKNLSSVQISWCICSIVIATIIGGISGEMMLGEADTSHLVIMFILAIATLCFSCSLVYRSFE